MHGLENFFSLESIGVSPELSSYDERYFKEFDPCSHIGAYSDTLFISRCSINSQSSSGRVKMQLVHFSGSRAV